MKEDREVGGNSYSKIPVRCLSCLVIVLECKTRNVFFLY